MQNQQVPIADTKGVLTQNPVHTKMTADQSWHIPNQQNKDVIKVEILLLSHKTKSFSSSTLESNISSKQRLCKIQQTDMSNQRLKLPT